MKLKVLELFGGIGACTTALKRLNIDYEVVDYVEIDKHAVASYNAMNGTNFEPQDITKWDKKMIVDLITHGSPCQDFSLGGKQAGGNEGSGTRSSLMYETIRIVEKLKPKYVVWENVKNLLSKKHRHNFDDYLEMMEQLGYTNYYQVLNAKDFGIPQNRERVFTVSIRKVGTDETFEFPKPRKLEKKIKEFLDLQVNEEFEKEPTYKEYSNFYITPRGSDNKLINGSYNRVWKLDKYCGTINLTKIQEVGIVINNELHKRPLTTKECWKLMGFNEEEFESASKVCFGNHLYKQAGNSIVVNVLEAIFKNLITEKEGVN